MSDPNPKSNYLRNIATKEKPEVLSILREIRIFSTLPEDLLEHIYQYTKFVQLKNGERLIREGMYDQEVYLLINGELEVYLNSEITQTEELIDLIKAPFSLFGERCILGEPRGASIQARGEVLLLGVDLSLLPDMIDGIENPEGRLEDTAYLQNRDIYTVFSIVLIERLQRLIKDQYKLAQKLIHWTETSKEWNKNRLLTLLYNQFEENNLSPDLDWVRIVREVLDKTGIVGEDLEAELNSKEPNSEKVSTELIKLKTLGKIKNLSKLNLKIIKKLTAEAEKMEVYQKTYRHDDLDLPGIMLVSDYLNLLYKEIIKSGVLEKKLSHDEFLSCFLVETELSPFHLGFQMEMGGWVTSQFNQAYILYLLCQVSLHFIVEVNQRIASYVNCLSELNGTKQYVKDQTEHETMLIERFSKFYEEKVLGSGVNEENLAKRQEQDAVEDLLASFGM